MSGGYADEGLEAYEAEVEMLRAENERLRAGIAEALRIGWWGDWYGSFDVERVLQETLNPE